MTTLQLYFDEDASDADLAVALRSRRVDVVTTLEAGLREASDEDQLRWAAQHQRVLYTFNAKHFCALHHRFLTAGQSHAGIVYCTRILG